MPDRNDGKVTHSAKILKTRTLVFTSYGYMCVVVLQPPGLQIIGKNIELEKVAYFAY